MGTVKGAKILEALSRVVRDPSQPNMEDPAQVASVLRRMDYWGVAAWILTPEGSAALPALLRGEEDPGWTHLAGRDPEGEERERVRIQLEAECLRRDFPQFLREKMWARRRSQPDGLEEYELDCSIAGLVYLAGGPR